MLPALDAGDAAALDAGSGHPASTGSKRNLDARRWVSRRSLQKILQKIFQLKMKPPSASKAA
jgi:hypothetical protein